MSEKKNLQLIAHCGLFCGNCIIRDSNIAELANILINTLNKYNFKSISKGLSATVDEVSDLKHYETFLKVLTAMEKLRCDKYCRDGGGSSDCAIRNCCINKHFEGCWQCGYFEKCETLNKLEPVNDDAYLKNIRIIRNEGIEAFLRGEKYW